MDAARPVRLLYIDDDPGLCRLVQKELQRVGYAVTVAYDGDSGVAALDAEPFDIVALDHYMPGLEGLDVLPRLLDRSDAPPVVYVTGAQEGRIAVAALRAGAADYVIKDAGGDFVTLLRAALDGALQRDRLAREKARAEEETRLARDRAEALLREVNHRVGNSLQLVSSFIGLQARQLEDNAAKAALKEAQARIEAVAQVHRRLYTSSEVSTVAMDDYLVGLVEELRASMAGDPDAPNLVLDAEPVVVETDRAVSLGVIVAELVTNAVKYAYPNGGGEIRVVLRAEGETGVLLAVEDAGVGMDGGPPRGTGLGQKILAAMTGSLKANLAFDPAHAGVRAVVSFER